MIFLVALGAGLVLTPAARRLGLATGAVDRGGDRLKIHSKPVPVLGGLAVVASTLGALWGLGPRPAVAVVGAVVLALGTGLMDDIRSLSPRTRVLLEAAAGVILVAGGLRLEPLGPFGGAGVVLIVLACTNAVNLLDGQDGLAGGLAAIAALGLAALAGPGGAAGLGLALAGGLAGFLVWNRPPARIFLGDGGAYAVGIILAILAARATATGGWHGLLAAGVSLGVFAFELALTIIRRVCSRDPLSGGDRLHSYDVLARRTRNRPVVTLAFWALGGLCAGLALVMRSLPLEATMFAATAACTAGAFAASHLARKATPAEDAEAFTPIG